MSDLQVVFVRDVIPIVRWQITGVFNTIRVFGSDLSRTAEALINGISATFLVESERSMLIVLPDNTVSESDPLEGIRNLETITLLASEVTEGDDIHRLEFTLTSRPRKVSGRQRLSQKFLKLLLTTPGTNIYAPEQGGGALGVLGNADTVDGRALITTFSSAVDKAKEQLIAEQRSTTVPANERLLDAQLIGSTFDAQSTALIAKILLVSEAREEVLSNVAIPGG